MNDSDVKTSDNLIQNLAESRNTLNIDDFLKSLPEWQTIITKAERRDDEHKTLRVKLLIAAKTVDEIRAWLEDLQEKTKTTYKIKSTDRCKGKLVRFKQRLHCHHNTQCVRLYDPSLRNRTKNTNCPSSITFTLYTLRKGGRGKTKPNPLFPCEITFVPTHNHDLHDALSFRQVSEEVNQKLLELFKLGHTPATALEAIRSEIRVKHDNYEEVLKDRKYCPDYRHCHYVYVKEFKTNHEPTDFVNNAREFLTKRIEEFNKVQGCGSAETVFEDGNYVICVCPPMMRRVHQHVRAASKIVFVDSIPAADDGRVLTLLTPSEIGGLPLGVILTSSKRTSIIKRGFKLLRDMVGASIFGGATDGPKIFITNESATERVALSQIWMDSTNLLGVFHVLQSVWRRLLNSDDIPKDKHTKFFAQFKEVVYARSVSKCTKKFVDACKEAEPYPNYCKFLEDSWEKRESWALYQRNKVLGYEDSFCEAAMKFIKDKLFERTKKYTMVHMFEFVCTKFVRYFQRRVYDAAHNRLNKNTFGKLVKAAPEDLAEKISLLDGNVASVPSEKIDNMCYLVYIDTLMCSCSDAVEDKSCKHVDWTRLRLNTVTIEDPNLCSLFYKISTGKEFEPLEVHNYSTTTNEQGEKESEAIVIIPQLTLNGFTSKASSDNQSVKEELIIMLEEPPTDCKNLVEKMVVDNFCNEDATLNTDMNTACNDLFESIKRFYNESPTQVVQALNVLNTSIKTQSVRSFVNACSNFGNEDFTTLLDDVMVVDEENEENDVVQVLKGNTYYIISNS